MATFNAVTGKKGKIQPGTVVLYFVIVVITFLILYPFWYCIAYSLSSSMAVMTWSHLTPCSSPALRIKTPSSHRF